MFCPKILILLECLWLVLSLGGMPKVLTYRIHIKESNRDSQDCSKHLIMQDSRSSCANVEKGYGPNTRQYDRTPNNARVNP